MLARDRAQDRRDVRLRGDVGDHQVRLGAVSGRRGRAVPFDLRHGDAGRLAGAARRIPACARTRRKLGHVGRSLAGSGGMFANFIALSLLPLADATAFTFATPLLVVPMAAMTLGETFGLTAGRRSGSASSACSSCCPTTSARGPARRRRLLARRDGGARRRVLLGGGDDPDPAADALRGDRGDRLLFLDGDGGDQRHPAPPRRLLAEPARPAPTSSPASNSSRPTRPNSVCWPRSACSAAPGRS